MRWLTKKLKEEIRRVFEPRYKRKLSEEEVVKLAKNLVNFVEILGQHKDRRSLGIREG